MSDDIIRLANLVADMRRAQKNYFRLRTQGALEESKRLERAVDLAVKDALTMPALPFGDES
jgi:hypothetical protein